MRVCYHGRMPLTGEYQPSPSDWVREQVDQYERSNGREANTLRDTGLPVIIVTTRGRKTGKLHKNPVMRVEYEGEYAIIASKGGAPSHPEWYYNLVDDPQAVVIQDGPEPFDVVVREVTGNERDIWWQRAVDAFPPYAEYKEKTDRVIPVLIARKR